MPPISSDRDLPKLLDTPNKQVKWAKKLIPSHLNTTVKRVDRPPMQGMFSRTFFLTLTDGRDVVLQYRTEPLDLDAFRIARQALGPVVPEIMALEDEELLSARVWAYSMTRLPGKMWVHGVAGKGGEGRIAINKSLGRVFARGWVKETSDEAVDGKIRGHIEAILASGLEEVQPYRGQLLGFLGRLEELKKLPLWVAHYDLNEVNVLIDEECQVTGLIDWELSTPLPFGVGFGRIHTIAGEYTGGEFWMPEEFEDAERAFWNEMFDAMPEETRELLKRQIHLVQDAVILGTLLSCFFFEDGKVGSHQVGLKALPKFLTYRIPFVRGDEAPYKD
jgi:hypothetical protein